MTSRIYRSVEKLEIFRNSALRILKSQVLDTMAERSDVETWNEVDGAMDKSSRNVFGIAPFFIAKKYSDEIDEQQFTFAAPTTKSNTLKLLRALQLKKPLLLEGSPGVGKTSLVAALARSSGHNLLRINLSDQTVNIFIMKLNVTFNLSSTHWVIGTRKILCRRFFGISWQRMFQHLIFRKKKKR